jgi:Tol biopolymer transport system component
LLQYRLVEQIGAGGMGVVWKAVDTTLDREVAIKVLPDAVAVDAERVARFEREAKLLASLNHAHIATIHGFHRTDDALFLVMELVEGRDLAQVLRDGPLPTEQALRLALQIVDGLQAAHDSGVVHRDLKPANIQLTVDGKVKILDLGLAKAFEPDLASGSGDQRLSLSPTMTSAGTVAGMLLGTAAYMSPEQARGHIADRRSDLWAFGCVLYEMLTGRLAFQGNTASDTLASVLKSTPDLDALPAETPRQVRRLLRRCLSKEADARLHHIADARLEIRDALEGDDESESSIDRPAAPVAASPTWLRLLPWVLATALAIVAGVAWTGRGAPATESARSGQALHLSVPLPDNVGLLSDQYGTLAVAPDGTALAFVGVEDGQRHLYIRKFDRADAEKLANTEGALTPFFSPDSQWIGFIADTSLKKISVNGGRPITLGNGIGANRGATWGANDTIVFSSHYTDPLMQLSGAGGQSKPLTTLDEENRERTHRWPSFVADTDVVLFTVQTMDSPEFYDDARIDAVRLGTGERKTIYENASLGRYLPTGHLLFGREGFLFAVPFDLDRLEVHGSPVPVIENVKGSLNSGVVHADFAATGLLAYIEGTAQARQRDLVWHDSNGNREELLIPTDGYLAPTFSPDGRKLAVGISAETNFDIWTYDLERETMTRLTFDGNNTLAVWSPDGSRVAFNSVRDGSANVYVKNADGSGEAELVLAAGWRPGNGAVSALSWSSDGKLLLLTTSNRNGPNIAVLPLDGTTEPTIFLETPFTEIHPQFSPDGRFISYVSDESATFEVYVRPYPGPGGRWQISVEGGSDPQWSPDGRQLFFRQDAQILVVDVDTSESFRASRPRVFAEEISRLPLGERTYTVAADGTRILSLEATDSGVTNQRITVVVNWLDDLVARFPR